PHPEHRLRLAHQFFDERARRGGMLEDVTGDVRLDPVILARHGGAGAYGIPGSRLIRAMVTLYERVGGLPFFERLVDHFYDSVAADPVLLRLYPQPDDLSAARRHLTLFLVQY